MDKYGIAVLFSCWKFGHVYRKQVKREETKSRIMVESLCRLRHSYSSAMLHAQIKEVIG